MGEIMTKNKICFLFILSLLFFSFGEVKILYAYTEIPVEKGGELSGTVTFKGEPPTNQPNKVLVNPEFCGDTVYEETYLVNPQNKGLGNVVISIEGIEKGKKAEDLPIVFENLKCHFVPHIQAGMVGKYYEVRNLDPVLHNCHLRQNEQTIFNVAMPPNGRNIKKPLSEAGIITANCDAHKFMKGAIFVAPNPYFAVTDKDGNYTISDIPPGKYNVKIWHESLPVQEKEIIIKPREKTDLSLQLSLKK
jgi:hypothetical protein